MSSIDAPPRLDIESLPLYELAVWLRKTAIELLVDVLNRQVPDMQTKLSPSIISAILPAPNADNSSKSTIFKNLYNNLLTSDTVTDELWRFETEREIAHLIGTPEFKGIPKQLWDLVGTYAWRDLEFQTQAAERIETEIARRTLFQVGEFHSMLISPNTCWLLLAMACSQTLQPKNIFGVVQRAAAATPVGKGIGRLFRPFIRTVRNRQNRAISWVRIFVKRVLRLFRRPRPRPTVERLRPEERRVLELLQAKGLELGQRESWAGLWDQWVLLEAYQVWRVDWTLAPLREVLQALPLHQARTHGSTAIETSIDIASPSWSTHIEYWFIEWNRMETAL